MTLYITRNYGIFELKPVLKKKWIKITINLIMESSYNYDISLIKTKNTTYLSVFSNTEIYK
jgi:hypothetical protein